MDGPEFESRWGKRSFSSPNVQTGSKAQTASHSMFTGVPFQE
jgi:hypothetical protein